MRDTLRDVMEAEHLRACDDKQDARYAEDRYEDGYWDARLHAEQNGDTAERLRREWDIHYRPNNYVFNRRRRLHRTAAVIIGCILGLALAHIPWTLHNPRTTAAVLVYILINVMVCGFFKGANRAS